MKRKEPIGFTVTGIIAGMVLLVIIIFGYSRRIADEEAIQEQRSELQRLSDSIDKARRLEVYGKDSLLRKSETIPKPDSVQNDKVKQ